MICLYKYPGAHALADMGKFDYVIVPAADVDKAIDDGWNLTMQGAIDASAADESQPTREELEQKATELGIKFDGRTGDTALARKIADALKD